MTTTSGVRYNPKPLLLTAAGSNVASDLNAVKNDGKPFELNNFFI